MNENIFLIFAETIKSQYAEIFLISHGAHYNTNERKFLECLKKTIIDDNINAMMIDFFQQFYKNQLNGYIFLQYIDDFIREITDHEKRSSYCAIFYWNISRFIDNLFDESKYQILGKDVTNWIINDLLLNEQFQNILFSFRFYQFLPKQQTKKLQDETIEDIKWTQDCYQDLLKYI